MNMEAEIIVLRGGRVVCPASQIDFVTDVWIRDGKIAGVGELASGITGREIDCTGKIVAPGFTDLGAELCDPGICWREDLSSGSEAAAAGGFTTVVASPKTDPVVDNPVAVAETLSRARRVSGARVEIAGALTVGLKGEAMSELGLMSEAGAVAFSDGRLPMGNSGFLRRTLDYARPFGLPVMLRPGDTDLEGTGVMHEGMVSTQIGLRGIPAASEEVGVGRAIAMARLTGARIHLSQVTTVAAVSLIRSAKAQGISVTCGVPARHLLLTDRLVDESVYDTATRLLPPLRTEADRAACVAAVMDGTIDCITADHVPLTPLEKEVEFMHATPGAMGLETAFSAALTALSDVGVTVRALAVGPAAVIGRQAAIEVGSDADVVVFDPDAKRVISGPFRSKGLNEPLEGRTTRGRIYLTICNGCIIYGPQPG
jgi:dihydroorotase